MTTINERNLSENNENADEKVHIEASALGTKEYWDLRYEMELENFKESGDEGEVWFGKSAENRIIKFLVDNHSKDTQILDLGCGNGSVLRRLRNKGFKNLMGFDYCPTAIRLATEVSKAEEEETGVQIKFKVFDILSSHDLNKLSNNYGVILDKGTWDAMSLCESDERVMHLCEQPMNLTRRACCQLVLLLNDTTRVPPCSAEFLSAEYNDTQIHIYAPPSWIDEPPEIAEDHATFLLGIFILVLIAVACTFTLNKLTKPKIAIGYGSTSNYDFMMWMPTGRSNRRWSMLVLLREMTCRRPISINRNSDISVVSSRIGLLPSYQSATTTPSSQIPPPPYSEMRRLTSDT